MGSFTYHAPAERVSNEMLIKQLDLVRREVNFDFIWKKLPVGSVVLNKNRQIICANDLFLGVVGAGTDTDVMGKRPGEAVGCVRAKGSPGGCGTSKFCATCGAVNSILAANSGEENSRECTIILENSAVLELGVWSLPLDVGGERYVAFAVQDISHEKRRRTLERIFFHDVNNTLTCLSGYSDLLNSKWQGIDNGDKQIVGKIGSLISRLIDEISEQSVLLSAERREFQVSCNRIESRPLVEDIVMHYSYNGFGGANRIRLSNDFSNITFNTDKALIARVLGNMIKNGIEAEGADSIITVGCEATPRGVRFQVHNPAVIPEKIQLQIFKRSFSTKGTGRGVGTYSMKFLSHNYLDGDVYFESDSKLGTVFYAEYPLKPAKQVN